MVHKAFRARQEGGAAQTSATLHVRALQQRPPGPELSLVRCHKTAWSKLQITLANQALCEHHPTPLFVSTTHPHSLRVSPALCEHHPLFASITHSLRVSPTLCEHHPLFASITHPLRVSPSLCEYHPLFASITHSLRVSPTLCEHPCVTIKGSCRPVPPSHSTREECSPRCPDGTG